MSGNNYHPIDPLSQAARIARARAQANPIPVQHHTMPQQVQQPHYPEVPQQPYYAQPQQGYQQQAPAYYPPQPQYQQPQQPQYQQPQYQQPQYQQPQQPCYGPPPTQYQQPQPQYQQEAPRARRLITGNTAGGSYQSPAAPAPSLSQPLGPLMPDALVQAVPTPAVPTPVLNTPNYGAAQAPQAIPAPTPTQPLQLNVGVPAQNTQAIPAPTPTQKLNLGTTPANPSPSSAPKLLLGGNQPAAPVGQSIPAPPPTRLLVGNTNDLQPAAPTSANQQSSAEQAALDSAVTSLGPVPYYSLSQIVENQEQFNGTPSGASTTANAFGDTNAEDSHARYRDEQQIGEGGTALVYRAADRRMRRTVALKRFRPISRTDKARDYRREMEAASQITHPYVVNIYDADIDEHGRYIAMEFVDGIDMYRAIKHRKMTFDINRFINFAEQALEGLQAVHKAGLLHLDLKPSNIMLSDQGGGRDITKLIDFGRAKPIEDEDGYAPKGRGLDGSIFFSSPEQILKEELDPRTDLYVLGTVFYWVLTHRRPFDGGNPISIMSAHLQHQVTDISELIPNIPEWLGEWVMSLIALEKADRPQSATEALDTLLNGRDEQKVTKIRA